MNIEYIFYNVNWFIYLKFIVFYDMFIEIKIDVVIFNGKVI